MHFHSARRKISRVAYQLIVRYETEKNLDENSTLFTRATGNREAHNFPTISTEVELKVLLTPPTREM